jgi:hypothetical protein
VAGAKDFNRTEIAMKEYTISELIDKHHETHQEPPRPHMGASLLGHPCDRYLWLTFRWAVVEKFPGRILRLFRRGHLEEQTLVSDLRAIGIDIQRTGKTQSRVDFGAHVSGSVDGIAECGVPFGDGKRYVVEFKTHSKKSFDALEDNGVERSKPMHYAQMQVYMLGMKIDRALYVAICKDDDRIWTEQISFNATIANWLVDRGKRIALSDRMPEPLSADPSWYVCKYCPAHEFCHKSRTTREVNCRTCAHSTAKPDSTWRCERHDSDGIPVEFQRQGCDSHVLHPDLVPWQVQEGPDEWTAIYIIDGKPVANGEPNETTFSSREILANPKTCANTDEFIQAIRKDGGRITG